jgi:hypothetical protein
VALSLGSYHLELAGLEVRVIANLQDELLSRMGLGRRATYLHSTDWLMVSLALR